MLSKLTMTKYRTIVHLDLDAFFCAVEEISDPSLCKKPFAVGGLPSSRGVVASCSYAARLFGVHSAMPMARALRICPQLVVVQPHYSLYADLSGKIMCYLRNISDLIEQISIDEAFIDLTLLNANPQEMALRIQGEISNKFLLPCSLGVASNKLVAKIANNVGKAARPSNEPPRAITIVPPGQEAVFLAPLPVEMLWGVGPKTAQRLAAIGIQTIGELARCSEADLYLRFGKIGYDLARHARGVDDSPIITHHEPKSFSQEITFSRDISEQARLLKTIASLAEKVSRRLETHKLAGSTVKLKIRWSDFSTITRQISFATPIQNDQQIASAATDLFIQTWQQGKPVRLIGVGVSNLKAIDLQMSLWNTQTQINETPEEVADRERRLQNAIDEIRHRFGENILQRGVIK